MCSVVCKQIISFAICLVIQVKLGIDFLLYYLQLWHTFQEESLQNEKGLSWDLALSLAFISLQIERRFFTIFLISLLRNMEKVFRKLLYISYEGWLYLEMKALNLFIIFHLYWTTGYPENPHKSQNTQTMKYKSYVNYKINYDQSYEKYKGWLN